MHAVMRFARPTAPARRLARSLVIAALCLPWTASRAHAVTGALCLPNTLNGQLKVRATGVCKSHEIQIGSFNGTTLQFSGINVQVVSGSGTTDGPVNGKGNLSSVTTHRAAPASLGVRRAEPTQTVPQTYAPAVLVLS